ncbi:MAG: dTDP-4-dehydrorhamnose reductase [Mycobacteriales bacterium]
MTRWLVTGAGGQLGRELVRELGERCVGLGREQLDICDQAAVAAALAEHRPDLVLNAAAYTKVDAAQTNEQAAHAVNASGPAILARACAEAGATLVHLSTDYVFSGQAIAPYPEDHPLCPASVYGRSKAAGEVAVTASGATAYIVRTSWVYGGYGPNFVKTITRLERDRETIEVVDDQRGSPTWSRHLAHGLIELGTRRPPPGVYHATGAGETTWFGLARAVFAELGADPERIRPVRTVDFPLPARRPAYSVLSSARWRMAGLRALPHWRGALTEAFACCGEQLRPS